MTPSLLFMLIAGMNQFDFGASQFLRIACEAFSAFKIPGTFP
jgi:hypothetical protein